MKPSVLALLTLAYFAAHTFGAHPPEPYNDNCIVGQFSVYNQSRAADVPWFTIDLDKAPIDRWTEIGVQYKDVIQSLTGLIKRQLDPLLPGAYEWVTSWTGRWINNVAQPYQDEIRSIANASGLSVGEAVFFNFFYEIMTACTSIVAEDPNGQLVHARNMDFGLFIGWNVSTNDWLLTERLRTALINVNWVQNGTTVFKSIGYAGYIGIFNGLKPGAFSITMDTRHSDLLHSGIVGIFKWLLFLTPNAQLDTWNVRDTLLQCNSFDEAMDKLINQELITSCYYIVGGVEHSQGAIIARDAVGSALTRFMNESDFRWYVLETNYDLNKDVFFLDDRRTPGNNCMLKLGQQGVSFEGIMNVLSSKTTLNKLTVYSTLMHANTGTIETYRQNCQDPCWAW